jgi:hypothetical protein
MSEDYPIERHPLTPFIPDGAEILMLGSFPPAKKLSITNFLLESRQGIVDLKKANFKSAVLNITPSSETTISGKVRNQQIHVIAE